MALEQNYEDSWKYGAQCASTVHVNTLSILPIIDGYQTKRGDRVLLKNQNDAKTNGIYIVNSTNLVLDTDCINATSYVNGASVRVYGGTINANTEWYLAPIPAANYLTSNKTWVTSPFSGGSSSETVYKVKVTITSTQFDTISPYIIASPSSPSKAILVLNAFIYFHGSDGAWMTDVDFILSSGSRYQGYISESKSRTSESNDSTPFFTSDFPTGGPSRISVVAGNDLNLYSNYITSAGSGGNIDVHVTYIEIDL